MNFDQVPVDCKFQNFEEYVANPDIEPVYTGEHKKLRTGPPRKKVVQEEHSKRELVEEVLKAASPLSAIEQGAETKTVKFGKKAAGGTNIRKFPPNSNLSVKNSQYL